MHTHDNSSYLYNVQCVIHQAVSI